MNWSECIKALGTSSERKSYRGKNEKPTLFNQRTLFRIIFIRKKLGCGQVMFSAPEGERHAHTASLWSLLSGNYNAVGNCHL